MTFTEEVKMVLKISGDVYPVGFYYKNDAVREMYKSAGVQTKCSSGFDLMNSEEVTLTPNQRFQLIDLGVVIKIPEGFHALLMPRSSTFKTWRILQSNGIGLIDEDFMGIEDVWKFPAYYVGDQEYRIPAGTRIAQFFLQKRYDFIKCAYEPDVVSRGGHGSSGL